MLLAIEGRAKAHERQARERRELAYLTAFLPRLKKLPSYDAFVAGEGGGRPRDQTPEEQERMFDRWAVALRTREAERKRFGASTKEA